MFSYRRPEALVPPDHPLRANRLLVNRALERLGAGDFDQPCVAGGRDSVARGKLSKPFYSVRSEQWLMEQVIDTMLFR